MKTTIRRGRVVLAAAAATALLACGGDDDASGGGNAGSATVGDGTGGTMTGGGGMDAGGTDSGDGGTMTGNGGTMTGNGGMGGDDAGGMGGDDTGGMGGDDAGGMGGDDTGGMAGMAGSAGAGNGGAGGGTTTMPSMTVREACDFPESTFNPVNSPLGAPSGPYRVFDRRGAGELFGASLMQGTVDDDRLAARPAGGSLCVVAGDGDDILEVDFAGQGEFSETSAQVTLSGGMGADVFAVRFNGQSPFTSNGRIVRVRDFEPGEDTLVFDRVGFDTGGSDLGILVQEYEDGVTAIPAGANIIVDPTNGDVWFTQGGGESASSFLGFVESTGTITAADVAIVDSAPGCDRNVTSLEDARSFGAPTPTEGYLQGGGATTQARTDGLLFGNQDGGFLEAAGENAGCLVGLSGDDVLRVRNAEYFEGTLVGGLGSDRFVFSFDALNGPNNGFPSSTIGDFTPGEDKLVFDAYKLGLDDGIGDVELRDMDFDGTADKPTERKVIVDLTDGEVWLSNSEVSQLVTTLAGAPDVMLSDVVVASYDAADVCPLGSTGYASTQAGIDYGPNPVARPFDRQGANELSSTLFQGTAAQDRLSYVVEDADAFCAVGGEGDDLFESDIKSNAESTQASVLSGGLGDDVFALRLGNTTPQTRIADFQTGKDTLYIDTHGLSNPLRPTIVLVQPFAGGPGSGGSGTLQNAIIVDPSDGEIWLATRDAEVGSVQGGAQLIGELLGAPPVSASDVVFGSSAPGCTQSSSGEVASFLALTAESSSLVDNTEQSSGADVIYSFADGGSLGVFNGNCVAGQSGDDVLQVFSDSVAPSLPSVISGGPGSDSFVFDLGTPLGTTSPVDIPDFTPGEDQLVFVNRALFGFNLNTDKSVSVVVDGASTPGTNQLLVNNESSLVSYFDGESMSSTVLVNFPSTVTLTADDVTILDRD